MLESARDWVRGFIHDSHGYPAAAALRIAEQYLRVHFTWVDKGFKGTTAANQLLDLLAHPKYGPDVLDHFLGTCYNGDRRIDQLRTILEASASAYTVGLDEDGKTCLEHRVDETAEVAARTEMSQSGKASTYLSSGWHHTYGLSPNPSAAYHDAIRAVEAAARPVVTPKDTLATLGKMITALRDGSPKWTTSIGDIDGVRQMMQTLWQAQHDRHGTDDVSKPVTVSQSEAEAAIQLAVTLVQWFRSGAVRLAQA
ncbi:MAG: hypothetical protein JWM34_483 [Ilumatobacteraceae bacterium]|nr:hypothetical protein [Ilumatobacteraceae bacterium]